jgi:hypothetical protein
LLETWDDGFDELKQLRPSLDKGKARRRVPGTGQCNSLHDGDEPLICPTCQARWNIFKARDDTRQRSRRSACPGRRTMYFAAAALVVLYGILYAAGHRELGAYSADVCRYGWVFCESPYLLLVASGLAAVWGKFVSIR